MTFDIIDIGCISMIMFACGGLFEMKIRRTLINFLKSENERLNDKVDYNFELYVCSVEQIIRLERK